MIEYILILLSVVCFAAQFAFTKLYEGAVGQSTSTSLVMLVGTSLVGAVLFFSVNGFRIDFSPVSVAWAVCFAVIMIPYYMIGIKVLSLGSLAIYSIFMMLGGMLVPFFYGVCFLGEQPSVAKLLGTALLVVFIILQALGQGKTAREREADRRASGLFFVLCVIIFFINGMTGVIAKAHSISEGAVNEPSFTATYCALTSILSLSILLISCLKNGGEKARAIRGALSIKPLAVMILLGAAAYGGNFLQLLAADKVPASVQFPLVSGGVIALSAVVSAVFFREKLSKREWISVVGAFVSTFLFAF